MTNAAPATRQSATEAPTRSRDVDQVLDAAAHLIRERGFAATTVREIAREAGLLPGSLHYRYPSKEAILVALVERAVERLVGSISAEVQAVADPVERVRLALRSHLELLLSGDDAIYVLLYDWRAVTTPAAREQIEGLRLRYESYWDGMLYEAMGTGRVRAGVDPFLLRQLGFGAANWVAQWYERDAGRSPSEIADAFWRYFAFGVLESTRDEKGT